MSGKHTFAGTERPEPPAWTPEDLHEAHRLSEAVLQWDAQRRATATDLAGRPRPSFDDAVHAHDEDGSSYILPPPLGEHRIARMVEAATLPLGPTQDELAEAVNAVAEAVTAEAARAVARAHPDAAVEVEYALWGTPALRYDGPAQDQAALYERGIPADDLLEGTLAHTPGALIAAASIHTQRTAAAEAAEPTSLDAEPDREKAHTPTERTRTVEPEPTDAEIAQLRALQAASFPTSPGTRQPGARSGTSAGAEPAPTRSVPNAAAVRGRGR